MEVGTEEATKGLTWAGYALMHAPSFGSGGFVVGILIFIWRVVKNPKMFICMFLGWALFAASLIHLWMSHNDSKLPKSDP